MIAIPKIVHDNYGIVLSAAIFLFFSLLLYHVAPTFHAHYDIDSYGYDAIATHFAQHDSLTDPAQNHSAPIQTVGYPFLMGLVYRFLGHDYLYIILLQIALMVGSGWFLYRIAQILFGERIASLALMISAVNIGFLVYAQLLLAETVCLFFIMTFFYYVALFLHHHQRSLIIKAGLALSCSLLIKPVALFYPLFLVPIFCMKSISSLRNSLITTLLLVGSIYGPVVGYMMRNYYQYGVFALAPMTQLNIYQCFLSKVIAQVEQIPVEDVVAKKLNFKGTHSFDTHGWNHTKPLFWHYLSHYPVCALSIWCTNVMKTLVGLYATQLKLFLDPAAKGGSHSFFKMSGTMWERLNGYILLGSSCMSIKFISMIEALWTVVRWLLVLGAFFLLYRQKAYHLLWLFGSFIVQAAMVTGMDGCCRYRLLFEPLLIMLACVTIYYLWCWWKGIPNEVLISKEDV